MRSGFDVSSVPSADYLLKVVLALYIPYTILSPFIGVFIDRFARRRIVWWSNLVTAAIVAVVAVAVLIPLGSGTTEGKVGATAALVLAIPNLILVPFGTALGAYAFWVLLNDDARRDRALRPARTRGLAVPQRHRVPPPLQAPNSPRDGHRSVSSPRARTILIAKSP